MSDRPRSPLNPPSQHVLLNISVGVPEASANNHPQTPVILQQSAAEISTTVVTCRKILTALDPAEQLNSLSQLFSAVVGKNFNMASIPVDFLRLAAEGMQNLHVSGRSNTIYLLTEALGTKRADGSDTLLPIKGMPMGLIEYTAAFFTASSLQKVLYYNLCMALSL